MQPVGSPSLPCGDEHLVLISWDGLEQPLRLLQRDQPAAFELLLFDYSGKALRPPVLPAWAHWLSRATHCKGEVLSTLVPWLKERAGHYRYIGLIDDDVALSVGQINSALSLAEKLGSISFSPSLHREDLEFLPHMVSQGQREWRRVAWLELKMSFVRADLFLAAAPFYSLSFSGYGIDCFVHPYWARVLDLPGDFHVFDRIVVRHQRPHRSGRMTFPNGFTGLEEAQRLHQVCLRHLVGERPDLIVDPIVREVLHLPSAALQDGRDCSPHP